MRYKLFKSISKSKISKRYKADLWGWLFRKRGKLTNSTRTLWELGKYKAGGRRNNDRHPEILNNFRIFIKITRFLYKKRVRRAKRLTLIIRNNARLRYFLGGMSRRHLKVLFSGYYSKTPTISRILTAFELLIICLLFRVHFIRSFKEGRYFIKAGFFQSNTKQIFNWNHRIKLNDTVSFFNFLSYETLIYIYWMIRFSLFKRKILWGVPNYIWVDWYLFKAKLVRPVNSGEVLFPHYSIKVEKAIKYSKMRH